MRLRTVVALAVAAAGIVCVYAAVAAASPKGDSSPVGYVTSTEIHGTPAGAERTPPPGAQRNPAFENSIEQPAQNADGQVVPPTVTVLQQGG